MIDKLNIDNCFAYLMMQKHKKVKDSKEAKGKKERRAAANHEKGMLKNRKMAKVLQNLLKSIVDEADAGAPNCSAPNLKPTTVFFAVWIPGTIKVNMILLS